MQTFLPFASFQLSAQVLDRKRLGKQRVEVKQLLIAMGYQVGDTPGNRDSSWRNHPACKMWAQWPGALAVYGLNCTVEWRRRGYKDSLQESFLALSKSLPKTTPDWLGWEAFHISHKSNLLRKDPAWYGPLFPGVPDDLPYIWPTPELYAKIQMGYTTGMAQINTQH
jgi:hypothetical protein